MMSDIAAHVRRSAIAARPSWPSAASLACGIAPPPRPRPRRRRSKSKLCDNQTTTTVAGQRGRATREEGRQIADALMIAVARDESRHATGSPRSARSTPIVEPADNSALVGQRPGRDAYGLITNQDVLTWQRETLDDGRRGLARSSTAATALGSTIAVSCDMCHPHAANTHPKPTRSSSSQLGRVALLRDMINWCIEHPVRGTPLAPTIGQDARARGVHHRAAEREGARLRPPLSGEGNWEIARAARRA